MPLTAIPAHVYEELSKILSRLSGEEVAKFGLLLQDLMEAAQEGKISGVNRDKHRQSLDLGRVLPKPTITPLDGVVLPSKDVPLADRIAAGNYNGWNYNITADSFPITRDAGPASLFLAHFDIDVESEEVEVWAKAHGYEVANNDDLLAVGAHPVHKDLQRQFPIVQLGSSAHVSSVLRVSCLDGDGAERGLNLYYCGGRWSDDCRFLLRKVSSEATAT